MLAMPFEAPSVNAEGVLLESRVGGVVTLTLNRPACYNALSEDLLAALGSRFDSLAADDSLQCVVIAAAGRAFCAGHDLKQMQSHDEEDYFRTLFTRCSGVMQAIRALPVPVIARVQGVATAAGCQLVATCDLAVAARSARFAVSGINVGLFCSTPAVALSRNVPSKAAFDMLVTGRFINAEEALTYGLINAVAEDHALDRTIDSYTASICGKSGEAVRLGKRMFYVQAEMTTKDAYDYASGVMARNMMGADAKAGVSHFARGQKT